MRRCSTIFSTEVSTMLLFLSTVVFACAIIIPCSALRLLKPSGNSTLDERRPVLTSASGCFPGLGFPMPASVPASTSKWWCAPSTEYAFVGFSYEVTDCTCKLHLHILFTRHSFLGQSLSKLQTDFLNIRQKFKGRYVRMYGFCDRVGF